jgi:hypothetical protein
MEKVEMAIERSNGLEIIKIHYVGFFADRN